MRGFVFAFAFLLSSLLLAEGGPLGEKQEEGAVGGSSDIHDSHGTKATSFVDKGDYLENSKDCGCSKKHHHHKGEKHNHRDHSHSHEDSNEEHRHKRSVESSSEVGERSGRRGVGSGSFQSGFGSGSHHSGSSGFNRPSSGLGSGFHHSGSSSLHRPSSGLGSGSFGHESSGLHGSSGYHGSSGLGSGSLGHGSSGLGHNRRPSSGVSFHRGTIDSYKMRSNLNHMQVNSEDVPEEVADGEKFDSNSNTYIIEGDEVRLRSYGDSCVYSNIMEKDVEKRSLECNGIPCTFKSNMEVYSSWLCGTKKCNVVNFSLSGPVSKSALLECSEKRSLIVAPLRCPEGSRVDRSGKCREEF